MPVVTLPQRPQIDYGQLGQLVGQAISPMAGIQQQLLPLLIQEEFKSGLARRRQKELIENLRQGGNGPLGDWKLKIGADGTISYEQKSPAEKLKDIQAQEDLEFYQGQPAVQAPTVPQAVPQVPPTPPVAVPPGVPGLPPSERRKIQIKQAEQEVKAKGKERVEQLKRSRHLRETVSAFRGIVSQGKGMAEEQEGLGLGPGIRGAIAAKTFRPGAGRTAAFEGQRTETTFRLNSILTGQNRVIRGVIGMIQATLPTRFDPPDMFAAKVAQSIRNAYKLSKAFKQSGYTPDRLNAMSQEELDNIPAESLMAGYDLTPFEERELEGLVSDVLKAPAEKARILPGFEMPSTRKIKNFATEAEAEAANLPKGTLIMIGGKRARVR